MRTTLVLVAAALVAATLGTHPAAASAAAPGAGRIDLGRLDAFVGDAVRRNDLPGAALAIVDHGRVVHVRGFGHADGAGRPVTARTPFVLGSVSKPVTAIAVMQLAESGRIALDAPLRRYIPDFRLADDAAARRITVRQLLDHTSGLPVTACETEDATLTAFAHRIRTTRPDRRPGSHYEYCSGNYNLLGLLIERVSGEPYGRYMERHVFAPLGMRDSFGRLGPARRDGLAEGHRWIFGHSAPETYFNPSGVPAGYLMSSAADMARLLAAEVTGGGRMLSARSVAVTHAPAVRLADGTHYGLGWQIGPVGGVPALYHYGETYDSEAFVALEPQHQRAAVLLINAQGMLAVSAFRRMEAGVTRALAGQDPGTTAWLTVPRLYVIVDVALALLTAMALVALVRLLRRRRELARRRRAIVRAVAEIAAGALAIGGVRWLFAMIGARNWGEVVHFVPDLVPWLLAVSGLLMLTGAVRFGLQLRSARGAPRPAGRPLSSVPA